MADSFADRQMANVQANGALTKGSISDMQKQYFVSFYPAFANTSCADLLLNKFAAKPIMPYPLVP
jgi:hypothetical protein